MTEDTLTGVQLNIASSTKATLETLFDVALQEGDIFSTKFYKELQSHREERKVELLLLEINQYCNITIADARQIEENHSVRNGDIFCAQGAVIFGMNPLDCLFGQQKYAVISPKSKT